MDQMTLIQSRLRRPALNDDLVLRPRLASRLDKWRYRKLILLSAPAGYGKSTLLSMYLDSHDLSAAWLTLDDSTNDLASFLHYVIGALRVVDPRACPLTHDLVGATQLPPSGHLAATLSNELAALPGSTLLVLDDYHLISNPAIHHFLTTLLCDQPHRFHLVIAARHDPFIDLSAMRANGDLLEIRARDLRFSVDEAQQFLAKRVAGGILPEIVTSLTARTEGWPAGLRLASLALRNEEEYSAFLTSFDGANRYVMDYLADEVLARQPRVLQLFLLKTSILERLCAPLCGALLVDSPDLTDPPPAEADHLSAPALLDEVVKANLFVTAVDPQGVWYRYHHLFRELLRHRLERALAPAAIRRLHAQAARWLAASGDSVAAVAHYIAADDTNAAVGVVAAAYYALLNAGARHEQELMLSRFTDDQIRAHPTLLMLRTWMLYNRGQMAELLPQLEQVEALVGANACAEDVGSYLLGEVRALRALLAAYRNEFARAIVFAQQALDSMHPDFWAARVVPISVLAIGRQMTGDPAGANAAIHAGLTDMAGRPGPRAALVLSVAGYVYWIAADLPRMQRTAEQSIAQSGRTDVWAGSMLGRAAYEQNDLDCAADYFADVVAKRYLWNTIPAFYGIVNFALTQQALGREEAATASAELAATFTLEMGNTYLLPTAEAIQAEIALRQGQLLEARQWADRFDPATPLPPMVYSYVPHFTLVRIRLAQNTPTSRRQAAALLDRLCTYVETHHNRRYQIDVLLLQALLDMLNNAGDRASHLITRALVLAQPSGFIRPFLDGGPVVATLLTKLNPADAGLARYVAQILHAFDRDHQAPALHLGVPVSPLTAREVDVLALLAQDKRDREIATELIVSLNTVRTHTKNIYRKLEVGRRSQAVVRAKELGLLPTR